MTGEELNKMKKQLNDLKNLYLRPLLDFADNFMNSIENLDYYSSMKNFKNIINTLNVFSEKILKLEKTTIDNVKKVRENYFLNIDLFNNISKIVKFFSLIKMYNMQPIKEFILEEIKNSLDILEIAPKYVTNEKLKMIIEALNINIDTMKHHLLIIEDYINEIKYVDIQ